MQSIRDHVRFRSMRALEESDLVGHYVDSLIQLNKQLSRRPPRKYIDALVGIIPMVSLRQPPSWVRAYVVTSAGTEYAAVRGVEETLARFYEETGILAVLKPLRRRNGFELQDQFPADFRTISKRGALLYDRD